MEEEISKVLGQDEVIKIGFEGKEGYLLISGNGDVRNNVQTDGNIVNIFEYSDDAQLNQQTAGLDNGWHEFSKIERYLETLIRVAAVEGHKVHEEINEAVKRLKELAYA